MEGKYAIMGHRQLPHDSIPVVFQLSQRARSVSRGCFRVTDAAGPLVSVALGDE